MKMSSMNVSVTCDLGCGAKSVQLQHISSWRYQTAWVGAIWVASVVWTWRDQVARDARLDRDNNEDQAW